VYEVGLTSGEIPFIAMERLRGKDLAHHLRRVRKLSPTQAVELTARSRAASRSAHEAGVVHRDLKPHNLFLAEKQGVPCGSSSTSACRSWPVAAAR
jgi:serine/threonine protein kinase